jgi:two-component system chemotaxis response regulator CheB
MTETVSAPATHSQTRGPRTLVVVGASAGGVSTLERFIATVPADMPAAICVVVHFPASATSVLPQILTRAGRITAVHATDGETLIERRIYVAPPDYHMTVRDRRIRLTRGPRIHRNRPAIDPLFSSAGVWYRDRAIGIVLSGNLDDGTLGMLALKRYGGIAIAQDPSDAMHPDMPRSVIENVTVDHVLPADRIAEVIDEAARAMAQRLEAPVFAENATASPRPEDDVEDGNPMDRLHDPDATGAYSCPDCGGVLEPAGDIGLVRYECRVGHAYSAESLFAAQEDEVEQALWMALRALEEKVELAVRLERRFRSLGQARSAARYAERARVTAERAASLRMLLRRETLLDAGD